MYLYAVVVNGHVKSDLTYNPTLQWPGQLLFHNPEREQDNTGTLTVFVEDPNLNLHVSFNVIHIYTAYSSAVYKCHLHTQVVNTGKERKHPTRFIMKGTYLTNFQTSSLHLSRIHVLLISLDLLYRSWHCFPMLQNTERHKRSLVNCNDSRYRGGHLAKLLICV